MDLSEKQLTSPAGALIKTTLVDYPGRVACTIFLKGCNLRCPYCYNGAIVHGLDDPSFVSAETAVAHLEKRKKVLTGFVISGGEPLLNPLTPYLIREAKKRGYKIKLDTNGTLPDLLKNIIENTETKPDFIALDIKTSPEKYAELLAPADSRQNNFADKLQQSVKIVSAYPSDKREFRTVLVPPLVASEDIQNIAKILPPDASWQFAQFRNENCLNPEYNKIAPYIDAELKALVSQAKTIIPGAALR